MFYTFDQNNSGGQFVQGEDTALYMIFEAISAEEANDRAESAGLYFNGCEDDIDCPCCGDRWSKQWSDDGYAAPSIYGTPINKQYTQAADAVQPCVIVHMLSGEVIKWVAKSE